MVGQMDSKNSLVTFETRIIFFGTFVIITSNRNVICDNTKLEGQVTGIGQSSPASFAASYIYYPQRAQRAGGISKGLVISWLWLSFTTLVIARDKI